MGKLKQARGHIVLTQEERFRMVSPDGRSFLFDLGHGAKARIDDLKDWQRAKTELIVEYEGEPDLETAVARSIRAYPSA